MKKLLFVLAFASYMLLGCGCEAPPKRYTKVYTDVFDTVTEFTAYCASEEEFERYAEAVHGELLRLHGVFDIYDGGSAEELNSSAGSPVKVPEELFELISRGEDWYAETGGQLNIALGSVLSLWHDCREKKVLPDEAELRARAEHTDISEIMLGSDGTVTLPEGMSVDLGAVAKGYAAQKAADIARGLGADCFALSCGGNVVTEGEKPSGKWEIGVENPDGGIFTCVFVSGEAVVTSGDYQRYAEIDGIRYHHIIDPKTLYPADIWRSVTVVCGDSGTADALSTALFCLSLDDGKMLAEKYGAEALWISTGGEAYRTDGFSDYEN